MLAIAEPNGWTKLAKKNLREHIGYLGVLKAIKIRFFPLPKFIFLNSTFLLIEFFSRATPGTSASIK